MRRTGQTLRCKWKLMNKEWCNRSSICEKELVCKFSAIYSLRFSWQILEVFYIWFDHLLRYLRWWKHRLSSWTPRQDWCLRVYSLRLIDYWDHICSHRIKNNPKLMDHQSLYSFNTDTYFEPIQTQIPSILLFPHQMWNDRMVYL